jgi:hypothetical protein
MPLLLLRDLHLRVTDMASDSIDGLHHALDDGHEALSSSPLEVQLA